VTRPSPFSDLEQTEATYDGATRTVFRGGTIAAWSTSVA
jgi:hypothetical protein